MGKGPFIHKFKINEDKFYIYDVNKNQILSVEPIIFDIIDDFLKLPNSDIVVKWSNKYHSAKLKKAIQSVVLYSKKGFFSDNRPTLMKNPTNDKSFQEKYKSHLKILLLNITEQCNLRCKYCVYSGTYIYERCHSHRSMPNEIIRKALEFHLSHSSASKDRFIDFYGGEPLIAFDKIRNTVHMFNHYNRQKLKYKFYLVTNGTLLNNDIIDFFIKNDFYLEISLDGPKHIHDKYRISANGSPTFANIMKNLSLIQKQNDKYYNGHVVFSSTFAPGGNVFDVDEFFSKNDLVMNHSIKFNYVNPFDTNFLKIVGPFNNVSSKQHLKLKENYISALINNKNPTMIERAIFEKSLTKIHWRDIRDLRETGNSISPNGMCLPGVQRLFVDTDGNFYPCERVGKAGNIGNVEHGFDFNKINELLGNYVTHSTKECLGCWAVRLCSLCLSNARRGKNFDIIRKKEVCKIFLDSLHNNLVIYATIMQKNPKAFDYLKNMSVDSY